ncbi:hypothetical protein A5780_37095 [Nocardia sp. 852002-20019_SCH5090214]|jgi:hypothetical protein|uniref:DUF4149 domain-containing protein n=1 Tax=Nocardia nova TaxID=37330 RepID=A0A2S6A446_9NOCA|nr:MULTISPECIES: hypothetical protein [Nocardia]OBF68520.1 hypothetical protein A9X06_33425 [Mycobacterium sp. 852002-51759_SCH5129042]MBF6274063.1 hypothetical protein [Nocardia nova]MBV7706638.1 hypothetical protein [Nocardia nova]OBA44566.1 hypothetical protein A5780_37095 [Nocardia sp. 852002-20019_SCH5090214]OBA46397.1 hypothetical protein A5789_04515 [Nocardia sp. 852002-51101_SCH5132738]
MTSVAQHLLWFLPMLWLGMVLAISFLEAPLKFRAPGVTLALGLGIGRLVFKALNITEAVLAVLLLISAAVVGPSGATWGWLIGAAVVLAIQVVAVRPPLTRRSNRVLAGEDGPRSTAHYWYIGLELLKVVALIGLAIAAAP